MLLAVFSDSHGNAENLRRALDRWKPDSAVFLGDGVGDAETAALEHPGLPFRILRGNCDWGETGFDDSALFTLEGVRIFAAHGHRHNVKFGLDAFANSVYCAGAKLGLYGHTHQPLCRWTDGLTLLNPGSIGHSLHPTFALVTLKNGEFDCKIVNINDENRD